MATERLEVELGARSYPIFIGRRLLHDDTAIRPFISGQQVFVLTNETVAPLYLEVLQAQLKGLDTDVHVIADGEKHKTLATFGGVIDALIGCRHNRSTTVIALGGGVVGDIAGFVAATYQRGVGFIQIPTTLLAQVDSSVGGKTAVNHPDGKNMIGAFYQPKAVFADIEVLASLPRREYLAGLAEVIKYGVIRDAAFFAWLEQNIGALIDQQPEALLHAVRTSCEIKADVVAADEFEVDVRAILNFGHTFGHALESLTGFEALLHGEAISIGMAMAADLSVRLGWLEANQAHRIRALLQSAGLPVRRPPQFDAEQLLGAMGMDKKVLDGRLRLVLVRDIGVAQVTDQVPAPVLRETLTAIERD